MNPRITKAKRAGIAVIACVGMLSLGATVCAGGASAASSKSTATKTVAAKTPPKTPLFVDADTVSALSSDDCWLASTFHAGDTVVFRVQVFNGATGAKMPPSEVKSVIIGGLPVLKTMAATYSTKDGWWTAPWKIPASEKPGVISYTVTAKAANGSTGTYVPFNTTASDLTIVAASSPATG